jgi:hypothetical protein
MTRCDHHLHFHTARVTKGMGTRLFTSYSCMLTVNFVHSTRLRIATG